MVAFLCSLMAYYMRFVFATTRWTIEGRECVSGQPGLYVFWHSRLFMMPMLWPIPHKMHVLVSPHRDGHFSHGVLRLLGFQTIRGTSSNASSVIALRQLIRTLKDGGSVAITPDGPRGPREQMRGKVVDIARITGVPIVPMAYATRWHRRLRSWDRFMLPLPFGQGFMACGPAIAVETDASAERIAELEMLCEARLRALTARVDESMGVVSLAPVEDWQAARHDEGKA
jgi:lysophospholipid acyltransferase (LPLAT)-like uncharacterized protein